MLQQDKRRALATTLLERLDATGSDGFVDAVFEVLSACFAIDHAWLYVIDYGENLLRPLPTSTAPPPPAHHLDVRESVAGDVISSRVPRVDDADGSLVWLPISQRGEAVGVLSVGMRDAADTGLLLDVANGLTVVLGAAIVGARRRYDLLERTRGAAELTLEAAVQWSVLAPTIHEEPGLHVAARVEPSTEHGGDAWDFSLRAGSVSFALFDAVGHGVDAANLSALAVNAYRWSRRRGDAIEVSVAAMDQTIATHGGGEGRFVTAVVCDLDRRTGTLAWVCAGHPPPLVVTERDATTLSADEPTRPLGLGGEIRVNRKQLVAGTVLLLYSDGVVEATDGTNDRYSVARLEGIAAERLRGERRLPVAVREILDDVHRYADARLPDDATLFGVRWQPHLRA